MLGDPFEQVLERRGQRLTLALARCRPPGPRVAVTLPCAAAAQSPAVGASAAAASSKARSSSSPAGARSTQVSRRAALLPCAWTVSTDVPASAAIDFIVVRR
jgi:hypothetical protein